MDVSVPIFGGLKKCKKKNSGKNVDYILLISSPTSLWFMLSSLPQLYNILYYICHVLPFNVMQFCAIMDIYYVVHNTRTNFFSRYKSYRYIHIFSHTHTGNCCCYCFFSLIETLEKDLCIACTLKCEILERGKSLLVLSKLKIRKSEFAKLF